MKTDSFMALLKALHEHDVEYVLVGGLAVILHGVPRVTEDVDLFVRGEPKNLERLKQALYSTFNDASIDELRPSDFVDYPVVRYGTPDDYYIDIMNRVGEIFEYDDLDYEIIETQGIPVRVATIETLIKLKEGTLRDFDKADVLMLKELLRKKREK